MFSKKVITSKIEEGPLILEQRIETTENGYSTRIFERWGEKEESKNKVKNFPYGFFYKNFAIATIALIMVTTISVIFLLVVINSNHKEASLNRRQIEQKLDYLTSEDVKDLNKQMKVVSQKADSLQKQIDSLLGK